MRAPATDGEVRVLVVDDEEPIRLMLRRYLSMEGYAVDEAADGRAAFELIRTRLPDIVLLDVMLPGQDGLDILSALRRTSDVPVILITARGEEGDRIVGLRLGADDYVVKPFSPAELAARIATVLRRAGHQRSGRLEFDGLSIDRGSRELRLHGELVDIPAREFELLAFLASAPRQAFSRDELLSRVWGSSTDFQDPGTVTEHVRRIRRRIEADPEHPRWIVTVRGMGYRFEP